MSEVLVTGGSGFLGSRCILKLLEDGHRVRATARSAAKGDATRRLFAAAGAARAADVAFVAADLTRDDGWDAALAGCTQVLHVASPFPATAPRDADELIVPARDGTLRVLRAARVAGVRRVVMTSSFAVVGYGAPPAGGVYTESDWTDPDLPNPPYIRSKTIAERAAWDFIAAEGRGLELAVVNPVGIFGPVLGPDYSASIGIVKGMLEGALQGLPDVYFGTVDVRDAADLHVRAMTAPEANGQRFIATAGGLLSMADIAGILKRRLGAAAAKVPSKRLPSWQVRLAALFDPRARQTVPNLGKRRPASNEKSRRVLGWAPRSGEEAVVATAESLLRLGLVAP